MGSVLASKSKKFNIVLFSQLLFPSDEKYQKKFKVLLRYVF